MTAVLADYSGCMWLTTLFTCAWLVVNYTRHTHSVNASCSYEVHEDIICIHTNGSLEDEALL